MQDIRKQKEFYQRQIQNKTPNPVRARLGHPEGRPDLALTRRLLFFYSQHIIILFTVVYIYFFNSPSVLGAPTNPRLPYVVKVTDLCHIKSMIYPMKFMIKIRSAGNRDAIIFLLQPLRILSENDSVIIYFSSDCLTHSLI